MKAALVLEAVIAIGRDVQLDGVVHVDSRRRRSEAAPIKGAVEYTALAAVNGGSEQGCLLVAFCAGGRLMVLQMCGRRVPVRLGHGWTA